MKSYRIIIAEDEILAAMSLQIELESLGHEVVGIVKDMSSTIDLCEMNEINVAILDVNLGSTVSGIQIGSVIQERFQIALLFMTGYELAPFEAEVSHLDVVGFFKKPVFAQELLQDIDRYFNKKANQSTPT